jgi:hypothetical protein
MDINSTPKIINNIDENAKVNINHNNDCTGLLIKITFTLETTTKINKIFSKIINILISKKI